MMKTMTTISRKATVCKRMDGTTAFGIVGHTNDTNMRGWFITGATREGALD